MLHIALQLLISVLLTIKALEVIHLYTLEWCDYYNFEFNLDDHLAYLSRKFNGKPTNQAAKQQLEH